MEHTDQPATTDSPPNFLQAPSSEEFPSPTLSTDQLILHGSSAMSQFLDVALKDLNTSSTLGDDWSNTSDRILSDSVMDAGRDEDSVVVAVGDRTNTNQKTNMESLKRGRHRRLSSSNQRQDQDSQDDGTVVSSRNKREKRAASVCLLCVMGTLLSCRRWLGRVAASKVSLCGCCCCCCGGRISQKYSDLKLSVVSLLSMLALVMNVLALLYIAAVTVTQYLYGSQVRIVDILANRASAIAAYNDMKLATRLAAYNKGSVKAYYPMQIYRKGKQSFMSSMVDLFEALPVINRPTYQYLNGSSNASELENLEIFYFWEYALNITFNGTNVTSSNGWNGNYNSSWSGGGSGNWSGKNRTNNIVINDTSLLAAQRFINSSNFIQAEKTDAFYFNSFVDGLFDLSRFAFHMSKYSNVTSLILLGLSLLIIIPMVLLIFGISLKASSTNQQQLLNAGAVMVLDTMREPAPRRLFQTYCLSDPELCDCFEFLECVIRYRELSQDSIAKQVDLFEKSRELIAMHEKTKVIDCDPKHLKSILKTERKLKKIEQAKQDMAFDVWSKYLDEFCDNRTIITRVKASCLDDLIKEIDSLNNKKGDYETFDLLPDDLFDEAERQVAQSISDSHSSFLKSKEPITI